jgi:methylenetetrahydrofolate reductase (NADPH)
LTVLQQIPRCCLSEGKVGVSFEFFPPRNPAASDLLWRTVAQLEPLAPQFVSVTSGAGGSTREVTIDTVLRLRRDSTIEPAAHMTCVGATEGEVSALAETYWAAGIRRIVALRGDAPADGTSLPAGHLRHASDLVACLRRIADFDISVAAFPETHPEALSPAADLDNLKRKFDAGAARAITQFFFDVPVYLRFVERARKAGIHQEIVPGILPIGNFAQVANFSRRCGASVPDWLAGLFDGLDDDPAMRELVAATVAAELCASLWAEGVRQFHFYTLNRGNLTAAVCRLLGLKPQTQSAPLTALA